MEIRQLDRITFDPGIMGGKPCIRGMRVTVGMIVGMIAGGHAQTEILRLHPYLEPDDIAQALSYAAWRAEEVETAVGRGLARAGETPGAWLLAALEIRQILKPCICWIAGPDPISLLKQRSG